MPGAKSAPLTHRPFGLVGKADQVAHARVKRHGVGRVDVLDAVYLAADAGGWERQARRLHRGRGGEDFECDPASWEFWRAATRMSYSPFLAATNESDVLPFASVSWQPAGTSCERTAWKTSTVASSAPAAVRSIAIRWAAASRTLYQTEFEVGTLQDD